MHTIVIAFNGTWNEKKDAGEYGLNTNVVKMADLFYKNGDNVFLSDGVGTRYGIIGKLLGGAFGVGGKTRIKEAIEWLNRKTRSIPEHYNLVVLGFSRGAALAIHFTNVLRKKNISVDFLGLWDTVGAFGIPFNIFGIPFQRINLGYQLNVPNSVVHAYHAMAMHETRSAFRVTRLRNAREVWFKGVHSDIGGGNDNENLSNITLSWMVDNAVLCGILSFTKSGKWPMNPLVPIKAMVSRTRSKERRILRRDNIHSSVQIEDKPVWKG